LLLPNALLFGLPLALFGLLLPSILRLLLPLPLLL
jgi:hypothetical protein